MMQKLLVLLALLLISNSGFSEPLRVFTSVIPIKTFVEKIGGDHVDARAMVRPGFNPHTYDPTPQQISALASTALYVRTGVPFEKAWMERIQSANQSMQVLDARDGIKLREMEAHSHDDHADHDEHKGHDHDEHEGHDKHAKHGHDEHEGHEKHAKHDHDEHEHHEKHAKHDHDEHEHHEKHAKHDHDEHGHHDEHKGHDHDEHEDHEKHAKHEHDEHDHHANELDPHVWTSPVLVAKMIANIRDKLSELDPANAAEYARNHDAFLVELNALDAELTSLFQPMKNRKFMVFHPAWGYFADTYNLKQVSIEREGKEPGARGLAALIYQAKHDKINVIFVQPQFDKRQAGRVANAIDGQVIAVDPLSANYVDNLRRVGQEFAESLK